MVKNRGKIRVLIADDHVIFREGLRKLLDGDNEIIIVGETSDGIECIEMLAKLKPDILLLDLHMPNKDGLTVLEEVNFDQLATQVVVLTAAEYDRDLHRAMRLGARGVVLKQSAGELLIEAIHKVHRGEIMLDDHMKAEALKSLSESGSGRPTSLLSDRENEVVQLVTEGYRNREISEKFSISEQTVKNHLHNIFNKLGVSDRLELALYALHHGMCEESSSKSPTLAGKRYSQREH